MIIQRLVVAFAGLLGLFDVVEGLKRMATIRSGNIFNWTAAIKIQVLSCEAAWPNLKVLSSVKN